MRDSSGIFAAAPGRSANIVVGISRTRLQSVLGRLACSIRLERKQAVWWDNLTDPVSSIDAIDAASRTGLLPTANLFALLVNPTNPYAEILSQTVRAAASSLGLQLHILQASTEHDFDAVFATVVKLRAGGLVIGGGEVSLQNRHEQLAVLALRHR